MTAAARALFAYMVELYLGPTLGWVDITPDVRGSVAITRGRSSEGNRADPGRCTLRLDNLSGNYSPRNPAGAYYGYLSRNTPLRVAKELAAETFGGTSSSGWTPADSGQAWTGLGAAAADFTESGGLGRHLQPLKNIVRISLLPEDWRDVEQVTTASIPAVALGASAVVGHVARRQTSGDYYWLRMEFDVGGAITAKISRTVGGVFTELAAASGIPGLTYTAGQSYTFRSSVSGSHLAIKIWPTGTAEPVDWTLSADDAAAISAPGRGGLASWVVGGNTNTTEVRFDNYEAVLRRFYGEVSAWPPGWTLKGTDRYVDVEAAGILRRLGQGEQPTASAMRRTIGASDPVGYWPLEDGTDSGQGGSALADVAAATIVGAGKFVAVEDLPTAIVGTIRYGTSALLNLAGGGTVTASLPSSATTATTSAWAVSVAAAVDYAAVSADVVISEVATPGGTYVKWQLIYRKTTLRMQVVATDAAGATTIVVDSSGVYTTLDTYDFGVWQNGGNISVGLGWYLGSYGLTGSVAGTLAGVTSVTLNATGATQSSNMPFGHLAVWAAQHTPAEEGLSDSYGVFVVGSTSSWRNEAAVDRLARVCAEEDVALVVTVPSAAFVTRMGWQAPAKFADLLDQCANADGGYLFEQRAALGLSYRTRESLYDQTPTTIAYTGKLAPPFDPVDDADEVRNDVTVKRSDGSSARAVQSSGRLAAVPPPGGVGVYRTEFELNLADDAGLADQAGWKLHVGTVDRPRYPALSVQLAAPEWQADPSGLAAVLAVDTGDVLEVTGLPSWAAGDVRTLVLGYTETFSEYLWGITFAGVPAQPWDVAEADVDRAPMDGGTLAGAITAGALSALLASTAENGLWTTDPADYPQDFRIGEERVTVTAVAGASSPQPATLSARAVNGVTAAWPAGTEVDVWRPAVAAL